MRILLVEDDPKIASFIVKGLRAAGYAMDHAADGEEGLHLALSEPYDAAIVDIMLPKLDGLALIRKNPGGQSPHARDHPERERGGRRPGQGVCRPAATTILPNPSPSPSFWPACRP